MRVYMITGDVREEDKFHGELTKYKALGFVRTEKQARAAVNHIAENTQSIDNIEYKSEDIPTSKDGFIEWLNKFCWEKEDTQELIKEVLEEI